MDIEQYAAEVATALAAELNAIGSGVWAARVGKADTTGTARAIDITRDGAPAGVEVVVKPHVGRSGMLSLGKGAGGAVLTDVSPAAIGKVFEDFLPRLAVVPDKARWTPGRLLPIPADYKDFAEERLAALKDALRRAGQTDVSISMGTHRPISPVVTGAKTEICYLFRKRGQGVLDTYLNLREDRSFVAALRRLPNEWLDFAIQRTDDLPGDNAWRLARVIAREFGLEPSALNTELIDATFGDGGPRR